jgi:hypothetical protein
MSANNQTWFVIVLAGALVASLVNCWMDRREFESTVESLVESEFNWAAKEVKLVLKAMDDLQTGDSELAGKYLQLRYDTQVKVLRLVADKNGVTEGMQEHAIELLAKIEDGSLLEDGCNQK